MGLIHIPHVMLLKWALNRDMVIFHVHNLCAQLYPVSSDWSNNNDYSRLDGAQAI